MLLSAPAAFIGIVRARVVHFAARVRWHVETAKLFGELLVQVELLPSPFQVGEIGWRRCWRFFRLRR